LRPVRRPSSSSGWNGAIAIIDRIALQVDDEIDRLSVLPMKESLRLLAGPAPTGDRGQGSARSRRVGWHAAAAK
jgi:hypothetical protein